MVAVKDSPAFEVPEAFLVVILIVATGVVVETAIDPVTTSSVVGATIPEDEVEVSPAVRIDVALVATVLSVASVVTVIVSV
jgi:hypothetical protein